MNEGKTSGELQADVFRLERDLKYMEKAYDSAVLEFNNLRDEINRLVADCANLEEENKNLETRIRQLEEAIKLYGRVIEGAIYDLYGEEKGR